MEILLMRFVSVVGTFLFMILCAFYADAGMQWGDGLWRLEISGGPGITSGGTDRDGDLLLKGTLEYEIPAAPHLSLGLRVLPLFVYDQNDRHADTVWGAGAGFGGRLYTKAGEYRGLFAEANVHVLGHDNQFASNSSNLNFLTGLGLGYKFASGWHAVLKWEHISNANLSEHNSGVDTLTMGVGYTF